MTKVSRSLTAALVTTTLSLPLAGLALADSESSPLMLANESTMEHKAEQAGEAVSDTWITTKVKSALLAGDATPGMDIEVETKDGVVSLSGTWPPRRSVRLRSTRPRPSRASAMSRQTV